MSISVTNHIIQRYRERITRFISNYDIVQNLKKLYNEAETLATYEVNYNSNIETKVIKYIDSLVIVAYIKQCGRINLVTCFYEDEKTVRRFQPVKYSLN